MTQPAPLTISTLSREQVEIPITARDDSADPTGDVVSMAFIIGPAKPQAGDFHTGSWRVGDSGTFYARCLIGPTAVALTPGTYAIWLKFTDNPEAPVKRIAKPLVII